MERYINRTKAQNTVKTMLRLLLLVSSCLLLFRRVDGSAATPVIGILSQPFHFKDGRADNIVASSYVKWLEMGGARSVPIPYGSSKESVREIFQQVDGVLFPGGASDLSEAAIELWRLAEESNSRGHYFPIWGTCLGFEYLVKLASGDVNILQGGYKAENVSYPLNLTKSTITTSLLYDGIESLVSSNNITMNFHQFGISPDRFRANKNLSDIFQITSTNMDENGRPFVSTIEPRDPERFPYYGVQYHPEKNPFEYATYPGTSIPYEAIPHSPEAIMLSLRLTTFFVNLAKQTTGHEYSQPKRYPEVIFYPRRTGLKFQEYFVITSLSSLPKRDSVASFRQRPFQFLRGPREDA